MFGRVRTQIGEPVDLERTRAASEDHLHDFSESDILLPCDLVQVPVGNSGEYRSWYQVAVANLADEEYYVVTADNPHTDVKYELVAVEAGETIEFLVHLEPSSTRTEPVRIEVTVVEYATDNIEGPRKVYYRKSYLLAPYFKAERFTVVPAKRLLQVRPWTQQVRLNLTLQNKNELSASNIELRLIPKDSRGQLIDMEDEDITLPVGGILRAHQELRVDCTLPLRERPRNPVQLEVLAHYEVPRHKQSNLGAEYHSKLPRPIQITYIPYMRTWWPDWLFAGLGMLILVTIFFGFPPVYKPELLIYIEFKNPQPNPEDVLNNLEVTFHMRGTDPPDHKNDPLKRNPIQLPNKTYMVHYIVDPRSRSSLNDRAIWRSRGWIPWNKPALDYVLRLRDNSGKNLGHYNLKEFELEDYETGISIDTIRFSPAYFRGYDPHRVRVVISPASNLQVILPKWPSLGTSKVKLSARDEQGKDLGSTEVECNSNRETTATLQVNIGDREELRVTVVAEDEIYRFEKDVTIRRGESPPKVELENFTTPKHFFLTVRTQPSGANVLVGSNNLGPAPIIETPVPLPPSGRVTVFAQLQGYNPESREIAVRAGEKKSLYLKLNQENGPPSPEVEFTVWTDIPDVIISVAGRRYRTSNRPGSNNLYPSEPIRAPRGAWVRLSKSGYHPRQFRAEGGDHEVQMQPENSPFIATAAELLDLDENILRRINSSRKFVDVSCDRNSGQILIEFPNTNVRQRYYVQIYAVDERRRIYKPMLDEHGYLANPAVRQAAKFAILDSRHTVYNFAWHDFTHLYLIATTDRINRERDLLEQLRSGRVSPEKWCIVGLEK